MSEGLEDKESEMELVYVSRVILERDLVISLGVKLIPKVQKCDRDLFLKIASI